MHSWSSDSMLAFGFEQVGRVNQVLVVLMAPCALFRKAFTRKPMERPSYSPHLCWWRCHMLGKVPALLPMDVVVGNDSVHN
jgi:hypothetical protein